MKENRGLEAATTHYQLPPQNTPNKNSEFMALSASNSMTILRPDTSDNRCLLIPPDSYAFPTISLSILQKYKRNFCVSEHNHQMGAFCADSEIKCRFIATKLPNV